MNELMPLLDWESEVRVVKQSASTMVTMLVGMATAIVPIVVLVAVPGISVYGVYLVTVVLLSAATFAMNLGNGKRMHYV